MRRTPFCLSAAGLSSLAVCLSACPFSAQSSLPPTAPTSLPANAKANRPAKTPIVPHDQPANAVPVTPAAVPQAPLAAERPVPLSPLTAMPYSPSLDLDSMDRSIDPCTDFYAYSCGGWMTSNPIPADQASWDVYSKLANDNQQFLWGILEADARAGKSRTAVQQKVGDYYAACSDTAAIDKLGLSPLRPNLDYVNRIGTRAELIGAVARIHHLMPGSYFFGSGTGQDAIDSSLIIAELSAGGLGLPDRDYYLKDDAKSVKLRQQYSDYIQRLLKLAGESSSQTMLDAEAVLRIETALARASLSRVDRRDPHKTYHLMTLAELGRVSPSFDWSAYFAVQGASRLEKVNVSQPDFLRAMDAEMMTESLDGLKAYVRFHMLTAMASYLAQPIAQTYFDFYSTTLRGVPAMPPRWKTCVRSVDRNLGEALGQEFVARTFTADTKAKTQRMTEQIETAMQHEIEGLTWMSAPTKAEALRKLHAIRNKIGYPDQWRDYTALDVKPADFYGNTLRAYRFEDHREWSKLGKPVDKNEWGMTPPTVNAYFNPQMNDINFPAGVLQAPLYDPKLDDAPNYGDTGSTIGHELTHAFDDEGRQFDAKGNLRDWWTAADAKGFEDRINCVRSQYATYVIVDNIHINSRLTSGEDVADLGGTLLAYMAWKKQLQSPDASTASMSIVDEMTPDQRFFIGMAQWACGNERPEQLRVSAVTNPHSPPFARVNGVVSDMPEFQKAFGCKAGQPMVHTPTCRVW